MCKKYLYYHINNKVVYLFLKMQAFHCNQNNLKWSSTCVLIDQCIWNKEFYDIIYLVIKYSGL